MKQDIYQKVTDKIIADLEKDELTWLKPWSTGNLEGRITKPLRHNGQPYSGINILMLWGAAILARRIGNSVVFVDEIEKAGIMHSTGGLSTSVVTSLLGMIEPSSARLWECPYFAVKFDLSRVNWILASNDIRFMSRPLLSRCRVVFLRELTRCELFDFAQRQVRKRGMDPSALEIVDKIMMTMPDGHIDLCLRGILRILDDLEALGEMPPLC